VGLMTTRPTTIVLYSDAPPERLAALTRDFTRDLSRAGMSPSLNVEAPPSGARGDPITLGQITLGLVTSGAVVALIECVKAYLTRERSLVVKITKPDGTVLEVNARNVDDVGTKQALSVISP
jgi:hypothetical protein